MRKLLKLLGIASIFAAVLGFGFVACDNGSSGGSSNGGENPPPEEETGSSGLPWDFNFSKLKNATWTGEKFTLGAWGSLANAEKDGMVYPGNWMGDSDSKAGMGKYIDAVIICSPGTKGTMGADSATEPKYLSFGGGYETAFNTTTVSEKLDLSGQASRSSRERYIGVDPSKIEGADGNVVVTFRWKSAGSSKSSGATGQLLLVDEEGTILAYEPVNNKDGSDEKDLTVTIPVTKKVFMFYSRCETGGGSVNITKITVAKQTDEITLTLSDEDFNAIGALNEDVVVDPSAKATVTVDKASKKVTVKGLEAGDAVIKCGDTSIAKVSVAEGTKSPTVTGLPKALALNTDYVKKDYITDETFSTANLKGTVSYWLGKPSKEVTEVVAAAADEKLVVAAPDLSTDSDDIPVNVSYTEDGVTLTDTYSVTKTTATVNGITIDTTTNSVKTRFDLDEKFSYDGLVVTKNLSNGKTAPAVEGEYTVTVAAANYADGKFTAVGENVTVTVALKGTEFSATYTIEIYSMFVELKTKGTTAGNNLFAEDFDTSTFDSLKKDAPDYETAGIQIVPASNATASITEYKVLSAGDTANKNAVTKVYQNFGYVDGEIEGYFETSINSPQKNTTKDFISFYDIDGKDVIKIQVVAGDKDKNEVTSLKYTLAGTEKSSSVDLGTGATVAYKVYYDINTTANTFTLKINGKEIFNAEPVTIETIAGVRVENHNGGQAIITLDNAVANASPMSTATWTEILSAGATKVKADYAIPEEYTGTKYTDFSATGSTCSEIYTSYKTWKSTAEGVYKDYVKAQIDAEVTAEKLAAANTGKTFTSAGATAEIAAFINAQKAKVTNFDTAKSTLDGLAAAITATVANGTIHDDTYHNKPEVNVKVNIKDGDSVLTTDTDKLAKLKGKGGDTIAYADIVAAIVLPQVDGKDQVVDALYTDSACTEANKIDSTAGYTIPANATADVTIYVVGKDKPSTTTYYYIPVDGTTNILNTDNYFNSTPTSNNVGYNAESDAPAHPTDSTATLTKGLKFDSKGQLKFKTTKANATLTISYGTSATGSGAKIQVVRDSDSEVIYVDKDKYKGLHDPVTVTLEKAGGYTIKQSTTSQTLWYAIVTE